jgi:hypothetical protein
MLALIRYQLALLVRSGGWLPPTLFYGVIVMIGAEGSTKVGEALGYSAAALVPAIAWLTRASLTAEPEASRHCVAAAVGPQRVHVAVLASAFVAGLVLAACGSGVMLAVVGKTQPTKALVAGLVTVLIGLLAGTAVGAVCNPPFLSRAAIAIPIAGIVALAALFAGVSPVNAAITGITPSDPTAKFPAIPLVIVILITAACWIVSALAAAHREFRITDDAS